ncbi:general substrate transporter [Schizophyllum amplum]|uniref:General substrate transporter n=1 Tax=Schizophyllum amplum TaxID=97359 RepID=A0A550CDN8_9AGAR|nr:general substrate transporter [Auriculariopsis ampla]
MSRHPPAQSFTKYGWTFCVWILLISFQYGYHISVLNQIQAVMSCKLQPLAFLPNGLPTCIYMDDFTFSIVTSVFTVGGLLGSLGSNYVSDKWGRKGAARASSLFVAVGAGLMAASQSVAMLAIGRILVGVGSGIGLCVGPVYLAEIAPPRISGSLGVLTQLGIVFGIMITQALGLRFSTPTEWRLVLFISCALSVVQFLVSPLMLESPAWLGGHGHADAKQYVTQRIWTFADVDEENYRGDAEDPLLGDGDEEEEDRHHTEAPRQSINALKTLASPDLRKPLIIVSLAMMSQQISVLYYSNAILSKALPDLGPFVSLGITIVNVIMTFPPIFLIERLGRSKLLTLSTAGAIVSLICVGIGLDTNVTALASVFIVTFVCSFAIGLGPVPFVMIPEVSPYHAVSALSSIGLSLNWIVNFVVGLIFLPLRNFLSGGDPDKEGRVFYVFAAVLLVSMFSLLGQYRH